MGSQLLVLGHLVLLQHLGLRGHRSHWSSPPRTTPAPRALWRICARSARIPIRPEC
jgi:hypothetical protein